MKLSFGMIFSIILIIIFLIFAFYAIQKFMNFQKELKYKTFENDFQSEVNKIWKSSQGSKEVTYFLPKGVDSICFIEDPWENLIYQGEKPRDGELMEHLDIEKIVNSGNRNKFCIEGFEGNFKFLIKKNYGDALVMIARI